jgi:cytidylate kinase
MFPTEADRPLDITEDGDFIESIRRAFARQPYEPRPERFEPLGLTIAVTREAGSRGGTIARMVGRQLGWQVYHQELLEYLAHERHLSRDLFDVLDDDAMAWIEERLELLLQQQNLSQNASIVEVARVILAIGARGEAVVLGRGAGCILPSASTLHVRVLAPLADRVMYMSQLERLTPAGASEQVTSRDQQRATFVETHFLRKPNDIYQYDLLVNSSLLGEDASAQLIAQAARAKTLARGKEAGLPPATVPESLS